MFVAYIAVTVLAAIANAFAAYLNFVRDERVTAVVVKVRVPPSWMIPLGVLQAAGALGLLVGFAVPFIGTTAAVGLVLYYLGGLGAHLRARYYQVGPLSIMLSLAVAALVVGLAHRGPW